MHTSVQSCYRIILFSFLLSIISYSSYANAPIITSLSVTSGPVGSTVTIKGTDFPGAVAWTDVYFGNALVTSFTYASTTSLTVLVPLGATYGPITVCDKYTVQYGISSQFFNPTYSPNKGSIAAGDMTPSTTFTTGTNPLAVAVGDLDGDAKPDVVVVNNTDNTVSVFRNTSTIGNFSFDAKVDYATGVKPSAVLIADMDNDLKPDIVVLNNGSTNVSVFKNNCTSGTISFAARVNGATGTTGYNTNAIAVGDIDHDGLLDIVATNALKNTISVLLNTSTATAISFAAKVEYPTGTSPHGLAIGDIDGDTNVDIIVANNSGNSVSVIRNLTSMSGTSSMATKVDYSVGTGPQAVALADIDRDGKLDIITSNNGSGNISILRNISVSGTVTLSSAVNKTTAAGAQSIGLADIDGDGKVDITNANSAGTLSVLRNTTTTTTPAFATVVGFSTVAANISHTMGDIDGDGKIDAIIVNNTNNSFVVLRNTPTYSNNANLSALTTTAGTISPAFSAGTFSYTAGVPNTNTGITITPTKQQDSAKIQIQMNGGAFVNINSGSPSMLYTLASGENTYNIKVTAQDGTTVQTYTLVVTKAAVPVISAITPSSAAVGTSATLTGNFFNSTAANNIVFFGGVQATVTAATATSLTVTVPTGATYGPVTVLNTDASLTGTSKVFFNPTFKPNKGSIDSMDMTVSANFGVNGYPSNVAVGDIDGDGKPDAVVLDAINSKLSVLRNTSSSGSVSFAPKVDFTTLSSTETITLGDINNDGKLDVVVVNFLTDSVSIYRNTSTIGAVSFAAKVNILCGLSTGTYRKCVIGDIDGDGKPDITLGTYSLGEYVISVLRNSSTSATNVSFAFFSTFVTGNNPIDLAIGDIDKDGKADIVTANKNPANATGTAYYQISVLKNTSVIGTVSFAAKQDFNVDGQPSSIALADVDGDGVNDIITCNVGTNNISVLINYSNTSGLYMGTLRNFTIGANAGYMGIADIDGDGRLDIAVTPNGKGLYILRNVTTTTGASNVTFAPVITLAKAINLSSIVTGDIDGDGKVDIAAINTTAAADSLVVFRNTPIFSRNNNLSALSVNAGALSPVFDSLKTTYNINVHNYVTTTTVTATKQQDSAKIELQYNGGGYSSFVNGSTSSSLPLSIGVNTINLRVTAQNGNIKIYTITITRACLANPSTTNLAICPSQLPFTWNTLVFTKAGTQGIILTNASGCDSTATLVLSIKANSTSVTNITACDSLVWNGTTYKTSSSYVFHTTNAVGCDSAATLNLIVKKSTTSWTDKISCDSVLWNGVWYNKSGFYIYHTTNKAGCDSAAALNLTVNDKPVGTFASFTGDICAGDTSYVSFVVPPAKNLQYLHIYAPIDTTFEIGTASFGVNPRNVQSNGNIVYLPNSSPGNQACSTTYATNLFAGSIVLIDRGTCTFASKAKAVQDAGAAGIIIVNNVAGSAPSMAGTDPTITIPVISVSQADGQIMKDWINAGSYVTGLSTVHTPTYAWSTGETTQSIMLHPTQTGGYSVTVSYENGCSQIYYYAILVRQKSTSWTDIVTCDSTVWNGVTYKTSGLYVYHTLNAVGCDSAATLALTIKKPTTSWTDKISCDSVLWNGVWYNQSGFYTYHTTNKAGCDSAASLNLTMIKPTFSTTNKVACDSLIWNNVTYKTSGQYIYHSTNNTGCDSAATLNLTIKKSSTATVDLMACDSAVWFGFVYKTSGQYINHIQNATGCDSAVILNLTIKKPTSSTTDIITCDSTIWNGVTYKTAGQFTYHATNKAGCDSAAILNLTISKPTFSLTTFATCNSYVWNGTTYTSTGTYSKTFKGGNTAGCDSIAVLNLTILSTNPVVKSINLSDCNSVTYKNVIYTNSDTVIDTIKSIKGCDSVYTTVHIDISNISISGGIYHPSKGYVIPAVSTTMAGSSSANTVANGSYSFNCIPASSSETIRLYKNNEINKANGVTTLDVALIQSHILSKSVLTNPYKIIAADVNGDNKVTTLDIVYIKRLILGLDSTFTKTSGGEKRLWSFVDSSFIFTTPSSPFPFRDSISHTALSTAKAHQTFVGCKLGDVNWDWNPAVAKPGINNMNAVELSYDPVKLTNQNIVRVPVKANGFKDMMGIQFTINFNDKALKWIGLNNKTLNFETGTNHAAEGKVTFLWNDPANQIKTLEDGTVLFELMFEKTKDCINEQLDLDGSVTAVVAYDKDAVAHPVSWKPATINVVETKDSWVVAPNPAKDGVIHVQMNVKEEKKLVFRLFDNAGRVLLVKQADAVKGTNNFTLNEGLIANGTYYLQVDGMEGVKQLRVEN